MTPSTPGFVCGEWYLSYEAGGRPREQNHGIGGAERNHLLADRPCAASSHGTSNPRLGRDAKAPNATAAVRDPGELGKSPARVVSLVQGRGATGRSSDRGPAAGSAESWVASRVGSRQHPAGSGLPRRLPERVSPPLHLQPSPARPRLPNGCPHDDGFNGGARSCLLPSLTSLCSKR